ncbi:MAG TPA: RNA polymerase sigma factor [Candidatus Paceibacterota bacterium]|nr:RNA polymerase sigma factor [Candidatus Paceibacterota bacterium]
MKEDRAYKFEKIYQNESDAIFRFCLIRVSNREQALDITQEAFLRLWQSMLEEKEILNDRAFLFTIAHHLIIDWYRKKKSISLENVMQKEGELGYDRADETFVSNLELGAEGRHLLEKISELTPVCRYPVYLRYAENMSPREIGVILGISANVASVRLNRGMQELRKIAGYDGNGKI